MTRLVIFISFLTALALVLSLRHFKSYDSANKPFDFEKQKEEYQAHLAAVDKALNPPVIEKKEVEVKKVEVVLDTPELKAGAAVYAKQCVSCHGKEGQGSKSQKAPRLAAQHSWYTLKQLQDMKAGIRNNEKMAPALKKINEEDMKNISLFLERLPPKP